MTCIPNLTQMLNDSTSSMEMISVILNFVLGSGLLATLLFYEANRRKINADAANEELNVKKSALSIEHQTVEFLQNQLCEAYVEIDKMQDIINQKRDQIIDLIRQTKELEILLIETQQKLRKNELKKEYQNENN